MTITFCNGKGGSGKTTLAVLLASALAEAGHAAAVQDTDPQKTATRWIQEVGFPELATNGHEYNPLFVDTPPRLESRQLADSIRRADLVLLVSSPSPADLFTSRDTVDVINREGAGKRAAVLFNQVQTGTVLSRELDGMAERIGLRALKNSVRRRQAYRTRSCSDGNPCRSRPGRRCSRSPWRS